MKKRLVALTVAVLMVLVMLPAAALADGPYVHQEFQGAVQLSLKKVTINSSTMYQTGHQETGGTISDNVNLLSTLKSQGSWTFTAHEKDGYSFNGWTTSGSPSGAYAVSGKSLTVSYINNSDYDATANFNFTGFTVTLDLGAGGTFNSNGSSSITLTGQPYGTLAVPAYTLHDGYDFQGWNGSLNINSSRTLTANYEYRVNFVGNTNVTITGATPVWTVNHNVTAPAYSVTPGYRFNGWDRSLNGITGPTTITANPAVRQYRLTLETAGNGYFLNEGGVEGVYDAGSTIQLGNSGPIGIGGYFVRWVEKGTGVTYPDKWTQITLNKDRTLIAVFELLNLDQYVYTYAEGSHGALDNDLSGMYDVGDQVNLNDAQPIATTLGYEFKYWEEYIDSSHSWIPVALTGGQPIITVGEVNDYRAIFGLEDYSISYSLDGGTVAPANPASYTIESGDITLNNPTKDGYTFAGWTGTDLSGNTMSVIIPSGSTGDRAYTANWTADEYSISYDLDNGTVAPANPASYTVESGDITLNNPTKDGYTFAGWTGTDLTGETMSVIIPSGSTGDRAYTANWTLNTYSISYDLNNGTVAPANPVSYTVESGDITLNNPTRPGFTFTGWTGTDLTGKTMNVIIPSGSTGDRAYTAKWKAIDYTITYDLNGGTVDPANPETYTVKSDDITLNNPTRPGFTFTGWTGTDLPGKTMNVIIPKGSMGDRAYTAKWKAIDYTITYNLNGGAVDPANPETYTVKSDDITLNNPTKDGYTFRGWTGTDLTAETMNVTIPKGSLGDRSYTANFTADVQMFTVNWIVYTDRTQTDYMAMSWPFTAYTDDVVDVASFILPSPGYDITTDPADTLTIGTDPANNVINIYYTPQEQTYTVYYYLEGTTDPVAPEKVGTGVTGEIITEGPIDVEGYDPVTTDPQEIMLIPPELFEELQMDNTLIFYYKPIEIIEPTAPGGGAVSPAPTGSPAATAGPTATVNVPEETTPNAPALPVTGENPLDWMLITGGLVLISGTLLLVFRRRKQGEK